MSFPAAILNRTKREKVRTRSDGSGIKVEGIRQLEEGQESKSRFGFQVMCQRLQAF